MDETIKKLIAIGASAAVNCHPCMDFHLGECDRLGVDRGLVAAAMEVGMNVAKGAAAKTRAKAAGLVEPEPGPSAETGGGKWGCGCG